MSASIQATRYKLRYILSNEQINAQKQAIAAEEAVCNHTTIHTTSGITQTYYNQYCSTIVVIE